MISVSVDPFDTSPTMGSGDEVDANYMIGITLLFALAAHLFMILGISFEIPEPTPSTPVQTVDVIIVNRKGPTSALSQSQESTTHDTLEDAADPAAPTQQFSEELMDPEQNDPVTTQPPSAELEETRPPRSDPPAIAAQEPPAETEQPLVASVIQPEQQEVIEVPPPEPVEPPPAERPQPHKITAAQILASRDLEIAHLSARIKSGMTAYGGNTRRKAINARTRDYKYSNYLDAWRNKVERIGNLNYPQEAKRKGLFGNLILHVALRSDGSIETLRIVRSSGHALLDEAAMNIVRLAAPYSPFPADIKSETDVLDITRTWQFLRGDRFSW